MMLIFIYLKTYLKKFYWTVYCTRFVMLTIINQDNNLAPINCPSRKLLRRKKGGIVCVFFYEFRFTIKTSIKYQFVVHTQKDKLINFFFIFLHFSFKECEFDIIANWKMSLKNFFINSKSLNPCQYFHFLLYIS